MDPFLTVVCQSFAEGQMISLVSKNVTKETQNKSTNRYYNEYVLKPNLKAKCKYNLINCTNISKNLSFKISRSTIENREKFRLTDFKAQMWRKVWSDVYIIVYTRSVETTSYYPSYTIERFVISEPKNLRNAFLNYTKFEAQQD